MALGRCFADGASHVGRAGEGNLVDSGMLDQRFTRNAIAGHNVHDASGQAHFLANLRESERCQRSEFRRL